MSSQRPTSNDDIRIQHKQELWATTVGTLITYNLILTAMLFAFLDISLTFVLTIGLAALISSILIRKLVLKTPEELLAQEDKYNERSKTNR